MLHIIEIFQIIVSQATFLQNLVSYRTWSHCKLLIVILLPVVVYLLQLAREVLVSGSRLRPVAFMLMILMAFTKF